MAVKVFTLEEANHHIPEIERALLDLQEDVREIVRLRDSASVLELLGAADSRSPENKEWLLTQVQLDERIEGYNGRLNGIQRLGCVLKDINHGVVDFYGWKDGRLIFLCWRMGEKSIGYWHEVDAGMSARRPVSEL